MSENLNADGQNDVDVQTTVEDSQTTDNADATDYKNMYEEEKAKREKRENRYKSTKKKEAKVDPEDNDVDLDSIVEEKLNERLTAVEQKQAFIREKGLNEIPEEVRNLKKDHGSISREQARQLSSVSKEPSTTTPPEAYSNGGRAVAQPQGKTISMEKYSQLPQYEYNIMSERIASGEVKVI